MNKNFYPYKKEEYVIGAIQFFLLDLILSFLFYDSVIPAIFFLPGLWIYQRERRKKQTERQKEKAEGQFLDGMRAVSGALAAGYSIENAVGEGAKELEKMYGEQEKMAQEFNRIRTQLELNQTIEKLFYDLAEKSELESISDFAQVFAAAKRTGGNLSEIIQNTNEWILEKNETKREIRTCIAAKKSDQNVYSGKKIRAENYECCTMCNDCICWYNFTWIFGQSLPQYIWNYCDEHLSADLYDCICDREKNSRYRGIKRCRSVW